MNKLNITSWPSGRDKFIWNCIPDGPLGTTMPSIKRNAVTDGTKWEQARMTKVLLILLLLQLVMMCWWWLSMHRSAIPPDYCCQQCWRPDGAEWPKTSCVVFCCSVSYTTLRVWCLCCSCHRPQPYTSRDHAHHSSWSVLLFFAIRLSRSRCCCYGYCYCCWTTCVRAFTTTLSICCM